MRVLDVDGREVHSAIKGRCKKIGRPEWSENVRRNPRLIWPLECAQQAMPF